MEDSTLTFQQRFDSFQNLAVKAIERDFFSDPSGRYLLVIPTAGGKTFTAVKAINRLYDAKILNKNTDQVIWTAHRIELLQQAEDSFHKYDWMYSGSKNYLKNVSFQMISAIPGALNDENNVRMVIIYDSHHGAANSYQPIFEKEHVGILGLTATPTRHDGKPLEFERESYSIGFPDLVKKGIILKPEVRRIKGGDYDLPDITTDDSLEILNNKERNQKIINELVHNKDEYKKVIIYVGTKNHVESLYHDLLKSDLTNSYDSISYITGDRNSRSESREDFIKKEKSFKRSIIVNVHVLSEGYDDPSVNTVIMATPTQSKLYYMQAIGRAIRHDVNNPGKKAFIVEVVDNLPNIRYRIDNRWLYADISDSLEPSVIDINYKDENDINTKIEEIYDEFNVQKSDRITPKYNRDDRYTMLLFRHYLSPGNYRCLPIPISNSNRISVSNMFNFLSE